MKPLVLRASGMATAVGPTSAATCAALRAGINGFAETHFLDEAGEPIHGSAVPLESPLRGREKLVRLAAAAVSECLQAAGDIASNEIPLLLCVAEKNRPGRLSGLDDLLPREIEAELQVRFHPKSSVMAEGRIAGAHAMKSAERWIYEERRPFCILAGVDSYLVAATVSAYDDRGRLLTSRNSDGFLPGEGAAAILLAAQGKAAQSELCCTGIGMGKEKATVASEEPLRADGLVEAVKTALADAEATLDQTDYRIADVSGEQYGFKEAALLVARALRSRKVSFPLWHPSDCIGEVGAAIVPCVLGVALAAARKGYAPGRGVLCHFGNDDGSRAAMILRYGQ